MKVKMDSKTGCYVLSVGTNTIAYTGRYRA